VEEKGKCKERLQKSYASLCIWGVKGQIFPWFSGGEKVEFLLNLRDLDSIGVG
jgi:hypothetical protein